LVDVTKEGDIDLNDLESKLNAHRDKVKLVAVTGASNVSGITPAIYKIARLAHGYGAKILVDAVQLIQHYPFSMKPHEDDEHIDFVAFSAHKCYTPFDGGTLIGPMDFFNKYLPFLDGAGTTKFISSEKILFLNPPKRYEAGYPDLFGVLAMGEALKFLKSIGLGNIAAYEKNLYFYAVSQMKTIPKVRLYAQDSNYINVPFISFNVEGIYHTNVARYLSFEHGIEAGMGALGADIYVQSLLGISPQEAYKKYMDGKPVGVVRISFGMYNTFNEIDVFANTLRYL
jgi:selenocysteine lyase/cysteine desulfurase